MLFFPREIYLLSASIRRLLDDRYASLIRPGQVLHLVVTNLRNRPLSRASVESMGESLVCMYHNLITGFNDFPLVPHRGKLRIRRVATPFARRKQKQRHRENTRPSPPEEAPPGLIVLAPHARHTLPTILTPGIPERADLGILMGDHRNHVRCVEVDGRTVTRVVSLVYRSDGTQLSNRWRVSDYGAEGQVLMSTLCKFNTETQSPSPSPSPSPIPIPRQKRKVAEEGSSGRPSLPEKRLRV
ncbi:uncharacterized protein LOC119480632 isoform X2 [Sebastes umbrosus]|uniref:uncharacterized protein LOC119480632 isoform X2 n=1 Tax=Sebastes umbrosus TaxID=72105 RepID=UPI00189CE95E|nr:uncharacterized protein LOC119480632 isoform X2 [Sebastes umbrosus]